MGSNPTGRTFNFDSDFDSVCRYWCMKKCTICKRNLPLSEYNKHPTRKDGLQAHCRECNRSRSRAYYARNREAHKKEIIRRNKIFIKEQHKRILGYLADHPCVDCGESDPVVLEFDHQRDKECMISSKIRSWSWKRLLAEIEKCEVRCANCHRRKTSIDQGSYRAIH